MAKLPIFTLIALTALVSLSVVSAYKTTITTTTIEDDFKGSDEEKCDNPPQIESLEKCVGYMTEGIVSGEKLLRMVVNGSPLKDSPILECCRELVSAASTHACKCDGVQLAFNNARAKASGRSEIQQILTRAQVLSPYCRLGAPPCRIIVPY